MSKGLKSIGPKGRRLVDFLRHFPQGITAKEAAERLGWTRASTSTLMSRLSLEQFIGRDRTGEVKGSYQPYWLYKPLSPPAAPRAERDEGNEARI